MGSVILALNPQILCPVQGDYNWNCRVRTDCPMQNKFLTPQVVYEADITNNTDKELKIYYGLTGTVSQERCQNHKTLNKRDHMKDN